MSAVKSIDSFGNAKCCKTLSTAKITNIRSKIFISIHLEKGTQ